MNTKMQNTDSFYMSLKKNKKKHALFTTITFKVLRNTLFQTYHLYQRFTSPNLNKHVFLKILFPLIW